MNQRQGSENSSDTWVLLHMTSAATCGNGAGKDCSVEGSPQLVQCVKSGFGLEGEGESPVGLLNSEGRLLPKPRLFMEN